LIVGRHPAKCNLKVAGQDNACVQRVLEQPKIWLIGSEERLQAQSL
jgi:hypothetical protein